MQVRVAPGLDPVARQSRKAKGSGDILPGPVTIGNRQAPVLAEGLGRDFDSGRREPPFVFVPVHQTDNGVDHVLRQTLLNELRDGLIFLDVPLEDRIKQIVLGQRVAVLLAEPLGIKKNAALLFVERVSFSQDNIPVEFLQAYYRADRYTFYNRLLGGTG